MVGGEGGGRGGETDLGRIACCAYTLYMGLLRDVADGSEDDRFRLWVCFWNYVEPTVSHGLVATLNQVNHQAKGTASTWESE